MPATKEHPAAPGDGAPKPAARPRRVRTTRRGVVVAERLARILISVGGIGTIAAVSLICLFLVWVVVPLFTRPDAEPMNVTATGGAGSANERIVASGIDEFRHMVFALDASGELEVRRLDTGAVLAREALFDGARPTALAFDAPSGRLVAGFDDGNVRRAVLDFAVRFLGDEPAEFADLPEGELRTVADGAAAAVVERTPEGQLRVLSFRATVEEPVSLGDSAVVLIDSSEGTSGSVFCALTEDGRLSLFGVRTTENLLTGELTVRLREGQVPYEARPGEAPFFLGLAGSGDNVYLAWRDGSLARYDARDFQAPVLAEELDLVPEPDARLTALGFLNGKTTLVAGDDRGRLRGWFRVKPDGAATPATPDGAELVAAHEFALASPVTALAPSSRSRTFAAGTRGGGVELFYMTTGRRLCAVELAAGAPVEALALSPREDALVAIATGEAGRALEAFELDVPYPEVSLGGLFGPIWYESYTGPEHVWQSSSGTDDFEPKLGLWPLVFGTLKATLYSMLFGAPLALLAAIYSSEFLDPRIRVGVKSTIEIMASLPSVVLGFLAALVIAPFVQGALPAVLATGFTVPLAWLLGAHLWQLLPQGAAVRLAGWPRFAAIGLMLVPGILLARPVGALAERALFGGDLEAWLAGSERGGADAAGGWLVLFAPLAIALCLFVASRAIGPWMRRASAGWTRRQAAAFDLVRFLGVLLGAFFLAAALAWLVAGAGFDPRGGVVDTYVQRNAMVVGFVMGFAIIPIIYTIAEDALSSVPQHLRLASLGAGATPWQTAVRIIVPTAMSGLFSALMVGLGRAVGETMIVLMATGNTPVMEWNVFNGFRTLSANIAVELPEAVRNSTHYRTLFLAALCLFAMTFVVNTLAELVRQRFRRRAYQL